MTSTGGKNAGHALNPVHVQRVPGASDGGKKLDFEFKTQSVKRANCIKKYVCSSFDSFDTRIFWYQVQNNASIHLFVILPFLPLLFTGFNPVTIFASRAAKCDSAAKSICVLFPFFFASSTFNRASRIFASFDMD